MVGSLFFVGHVSIDKVRNINGVHVQPGGAALYAAVAARTLLDKVRLVSIIGKDYNFIDFLRPFSLRYVKIFNMPSTRFEILYDERWEAHYLKVEYGAGSRISASTIPIEALSPYNMIHISPIPPKRLERIISKIEDKSPKTPISINTWIGYMRGKRDREILREIASKVEFFILNDSEAKALAEANSLSTAIRILEAKMLIVTLGELGAIIRSEDGDVRMVPALNFPLKKVIDTTGAGDVWCGAFLAAYKLSGDLMKAVTAASIISSIKCSGWGFSKLENLRFNGVDEVIDYVIGLREGGLQKKISDYYET